MLRSKGNSESALLIAGFAAIYLIWGTTYLAMKIGLESIPPFAIAGSRFLIAGSVTYLALRLLGIEPPSRVQWRNASLIGILLMVGGNGLVMWAIQYIPSGIAAVIVATMPVWMVLFDWLFFKGPAPNRQVVCGLVVGFTGIVLLINPQQTVPGGQSLNIIGCLVCMSAPMFWAFGSLQSRVTDLPSNTFMSVALQMITGGAVLLAISVLLGEHKLIVLSEITLRSISAVVYLMIFGSIIALGTYMWLLRHAPAARVSTYTYVNPIIAVILGWLILDETITFQMLFAIGIILAAVMLIVANKSRVKSKPERRTISQQPSSAR